MKTIFTALLAAGLLFGCVTPTGSSVSPERVQAITALASYGSGVALIMARPESAPALAVARNVACTLRDEQNWNLTTLALALRAAGLTQLDSTEGTLIVGPVCFLVDSYLVRTNNLGENVYARAVITGACEGLSLLPQTAPVRAYGPSITAEAGLRLRAEGTRPK